MKTIYLTTLLLTTITFTGCGGGNSNSEHNEENPTSDNSSNNNKKLNAYNVQGYELGFNYERGTSASISFGCDGSFAMNISLSGVTRTSIHGDEITVLNSHQLKLVSSQTSEKILISLDTEENIIEGVSQVSELDNYTINSIKKTSSCN